MRGCYERIHFFEAISCAIGSNKYFRCIINFLHVAPIGYFGNWLHNFREINKDFYEVKLNVRFVHALNLEVDAKFKDSIFR